MTEIGIRRINLAIVFIMIASLLLGAMPLVMDEPDEFKVFEQPDTGTRATRLVPGTYGTIGAAISAANSGDIIQVSAGTYYENLAVPAGKSLQIIGAGPATTTIDGSTNVIHLHADNCIIDGFTITDGSTSSTMAGILIGSDNNIVRNCNVTENGQGIMIKGGSNNVIENTTVHDNWWYGIRSDPGSQASNYQYGFETSLPSGWTTYSTTYGTQYRSTTDTPNSGSYHYKMASTSDSYSALNVLTYHHSGSACTQFSFYHKNPGGADELTTLPTSSFSGYSNADGVCISDDGIWWDDVWSAAGSSFYSYYSYDPSTWVTDTTDFYIRFQQYDDFTWGTDGRAWDDIRLDFNVDINADNNAVRNCTIQENWNDGVFFNGGDDHSVINSYIHNNGDGGVRTRGNDTTIRDCHIRKNLLDAVYLDQTNRTVIENCVLQDNHWSGVWVDNVNDLKVLNTTIELNEQVGMLFTQGKDVHIENCSIVDNDINGLHSLNELYFNGFETPLNGDWTTYTSSGLGRNIRTTGNFPNSGSYHS